MADIPNIPRYTPPAATLPAEVPHLDPTDHPYPWRAACRYCRGVLEYDPDKKGAAFWTEITGPFTSTVECKKAPRRSDDELGLHKPEVAVSRNSEHIGPVPDSMLPTFPEYE